MRLTWNTINKRIIRCTAAVMLVTSLIVGSSTAAECKKTETRWTKLFDKYRDKKNTDRLIFVKYTGGSNCRVMMYKKQKKKTGKYTWKRIFSCKGYLGQNGLGKKMEGDMKTPVGTFKVNTPFGIKDDPGCKLPYLKLNKYYYWSEEEETYNQLVDVRDLGRTSMKGEHLIDYNPSYNYSINMGYNKKNTYLKGSALFLHCTGYNPYTAGCVAIPEKYMKKVLKNVTKKTRICIYPIN